MLSDFVYCPPTCPAYTLVYADEALLVLNKAAGLLTVPGRAEAHKDCLETRVQQDFPMARIVHRLDMATSGLLIMPLSRDAHRRLQWQFENRSIQKTYEAIVAGSFSEASREITEPVITDWPNRPKQKVCYETGKKAHTTVQVIGPVDYGDIKATRVRLTPHTGRTHQLRVHMQSIGHPILGDRLYAEPEQIKSSDRLLLQARELSFTHPIENRAMTFSLDADF